MRIGNFHAAATHDTQKANAMWFSDSRARNVRSFWCNFIRGFAQVLRYCGEEWLDIPV